MHSSSDWFKALFHHRARRLYRWPLVPGYEDRSKFHRMIWSLVVSTSEKHSTKP